MSKDRDSSGCLKSSLAIMGVVGSTAYLSNIGAGVVEILPDNIPVAGNLDELFASFVLFVSLAALGTGPFARKKDRLSNKAVDSTATRVTPPASSLRSGQESRHRQP